jgi:hypothetical protein
LIGGIFNVAGQAMRGEKQGSGLGRMEARKGYQQAAEAHYHQHLNQQYQAESSKNQKYPNQQYGYADLPYQNPYGRDYQGIGQGKLVGPVGAFKKLLRKVRGSSIRRTRASYVIMSIG